MADVVFFVLGAVVGSFLNVVIYRMPLGQSIVLPPSACPSCGARLRARDNIPIVSYLLLRGRCRDCGCRISPRYVGVELLAAGLAVLLHRALGTSSAFFVYLALSYVLIVVAFIDLDVRIIPDRLTLPGIALGIVVAPLLGLTTLPESLLGVAVGGGSLYLVGMIGTLVLRKESMGGGDIKLAAMLGAFLGWKAVLLLLFMAFFMGAAVGTAALAVKGRDWDRSVPFGPFIALSALFAMAYGDSVLSWYRGFLG